MKNTLQSLARITNTTHIFAVLVLAAVGAIFLVPGPAHRAATPAPVANRAPLGHIFKTSLVSLRPVATTTSTTVPPTTTTTAAAPVPVPAPVPVSAPVVVPTTAPPAPAPVVPSGYGCGPALAYLQAHAAPGFIFQCPGYAQGHQAMTCDNVAGVCPGTKLIAIAVPCPAAYMNEASNSWVVTGQSNAAIDPYGYCQ
jgi:hypothetical protein